MTVLFADVVHSMDIAAAVGSERLREIMAELVDCASSWCSDMAAPWTNSPVTASWRCSAHRWLWRITLSRVSGRAGIQQAAQVVAAGVNRRDGIELTVRVGLNSGQVIAGEIGSGTLGYTTVGEHVGMAQRMESAAPAGGVMLSLSTARLVDGVAALGEPELVQIKGADEPVPARRLLAVGQHRAATRAESKLVGRRWEMSAVEGLLDRGD